MPPPNKRRERGHNGESRRRHFEDDDEELSKNVDVKSSAEETDKKKAKKRQSGRRRERRRSHDGRKKGKKSRNEKLEDKGFHRVNISDLDEVSSRSLSKEDAPPGQEPKRRKPMNVGDRVLSGTRTFEIVKLLGCGGFGEVYKVQLVGAPGQFFAMKTELRYLHASQNRLKKDVQVFEDIEETKANLKHFVRMVDKGMTNKYKFIVMTLTGPSLTEIRNERLRADFSRSTAIRVAMQTLQCVHDIHALGYVHRDVKPSNFTIGPPPKTNVIFVLDFGISKKIKGGLKNKRDRILVQGEIGTLRYASRSAHRSQEPCRRDDLESWLYMSLELFDRKVLPWRKMVYDGQVLAHKEEFFKHKYPRIYRKVPERFRELTEYMGQLGIEEEPNYDKIAMILIQVLKQMKCGYKDPYDWELAERFGTLVRDEASSVSSSFAELSIISDEKEPKKKTKKEEDEAQSEMTERTERTVISEENVEMESPGTYAKNRKKKAKKIKKRRSKSQSQKEPSKNAKIARERPTRPAEVFTNVQPDDELNSVTGEECEDSEAIREL